MIQADYPDSEQIEKIDIVVVDDDQLLLEMVSWILRKKQVHHRLFTDPGDAMACLCEVMPEILVVDYYMPIQNGVDFLSQLKRSIGQTSSSLYLCSSILPEQKNIDQIEALGAQILDKSVLCNPTALIKLLDSKQHVKSYK